MPELLEVPSGAAAGGENPTEDASGPPTVPSGAGWTASRDPDLDGGWRSGFEGVFVDECESDQAGGARVRYLGDYELLDVIGQGGMGIVFRARQISLNRTVALKVLRIDGAPSESDLRRFRDEAEAIASLDHASIVPIYEVGTHEGYHYFSMKLIPGRSLREATPRLRRDFRAIGKILAGAARGVQHAHERGILHRDIKPANILLDSDDRPHVSDFGLARRIGSGDVELTRAGTVAGTPAYMAPEQTTATRGSITTATDVYGLGAVLYALLSGRAPYRGSSMLEILDAVRELDPDLPSTGDSTIPRELEAICRKCLKKDPKGRYHSARELADDLDRWLEGRPITALPVGPGRRAGLWCKRKPLVAGLAAALLISAVVGSTGILINWREVLRQRDELARANARYRSELETSRLFNDFLVSDLLGWTSPFAAGRRDVPVSTLLDRSAARASARFVGRPKVEGSFHQIIGHGFLAIGKLPQAEAELLHAARLRETLPEGDELDRLSGEYVLARLRMEQARYDQAEAHARKAFDGRRRRLGEGDEATLEAAELLGVVLKLRGKVAESRALLEETANVAGEGLGGGHPVTLHARTDLAILAHDQGRVVEAFRSLDQLVGAATLVFGQDHPETLFARSRLGVAALSVGQAGRAKEILAAAVGPARDVLGPDHPETLRIVANLAAVRSRLGDCAEAAKGIEEALKGQRLALPSGHIDCLETEMNGMVLLLQQGKTAEAEPRLRDLIPRLRNLIPQLRAGLKPDDPILGQALATTAGALRELDKTAEAEPLIAEAIWIFKQKFAPEDSRIVDAEAIRAAVCLANNHLTEAEKAAAFVVESRSRPGAVASPWMLGASKSVLGGVLAAREQFEDAERLLLEGFRELQADPQAPQRRSAESLERLIRLYEKSGRPDKAAQWRALPPLRLGE